MSDDLWENSHDTPCAYCGGTPCYTLVDGKDAVCDGCVGKMWRRWENESRAERSVGVSDANSEGYDETD